MVPLKFSHVDLHRSRLLRGNVMDVAQLTWHIAEPSRPFVDNWHLGAVGEALEALYLKQIKNLVVNIPPGFMKSLSIGVFWPIWVWLQDQTRRFMFASFDPNLTLRDARRAKEILTSDWFKLRVPELEIAGGANSGVEKYGNTKGGWRMATSVAGKATGNHCDYFGVDDPIKPRDVTAKGLEIAENWWKGTVPTRLTTSGEGRIIAMQRLQEKDLSGLEEENPDFHFLVLPMHYNSKHIHAYAKDPRKEGELLWPEYRSEEEVRALEKDLGESAEAQLEQAPTQPKTNMFKEEYLKQYYYQEPERFDDIVISCDFTFKAKAGCDNVAFGVIGRVGADFYVLRVIAEKLDFDQCCDVLEGLTIDWPHAFRKLVEDKANGPAIITHMQNKIFGLEEIDPRGGKIARANAIIPILKSRHLLLPAPELQAQTKYAWVNGFVKELRGFPLRAKDDQVDMLTQALCEMTGNSNRLQEIMAEYKRQQQMREANEAAQKAPDPKPVHWATELKNGL